MDKYEYKVRADEIKALIAEGEYAEAVEIADTIDWRRVRSVMMLCTVSDLYKINRRYQESKDILLLAYEKHPTGRLIVYSLCELSIKMEEYVQAIEYYKEFVQIAPKDSGRYVLQYRLYEAQDVSLEERIAVLEEFKKKDYREKWAYELAYLYHRIGLATKCVEECDEMFLWFGEGKYVLKALELKALHAPLSAEQQEKFNLWTGHGKEVEPVQPDDQFEEESDKELMIEASAAEMSEVSGDTRIAGTVSHRADQFAEHQPIAELSTTELPEVKPVDVGQYNTINLQKELAESMKELLREEVPDVAEAVFGKEEEETAEPGTVTEEIVLYEEEDASEPEEEPEAELAYEAEDELEDDLPYEAGDEAEEDLPYETEGEAEEELTYESEGEPEDELTYETEEEPEEGRDPIKESIIAPLLQETVRMPKAEEIGEAMAQEEARRETAAEPPKNKPETQPKAQSKMVRMDTMELETVGAQLASEDTAAFDTAQVLEQIRREAEQKHSSDYLIPGARTGTLTPLNTKPSEYDKMLSQEYDGQISLVVPEMERIEKQITGQLSIDDIMAEWEQMKKTTREKQTEDIRQRILEQTGNLFKNFDEETKNGLLEQLEKMVVEAIRKESEKKPAIKKVILPDDVEDDVDSSREEEPESVVKMEEPEEPVDDDGVEELEEIEEPAEDAVDEEAARIDSGEEPEERSRTAETDGTSEETEETGQAEEESAEAGAKAAKNADSADKAKNGKNGAPKQSGQEAAKKNIGAVTPSNREMTPEENEIFGQFVHQRKVKQQLVTALDNMSLASCTGNVVLTGEEDAAVLALAKGLIREMQNSDNNFSGKVAKITGAVLNKKDVAATFAKLDNGALIIEKASGMKPPTVAKMGKVLDQYNKGLLLLITDTKPKMNKFLEHNASVQHNFNLRIDIEPLDDEMLVKYAKQYAEEREYSIDEFGILALHTRIADNQTSDHEVTLAEIREFVDEAIYYANKKTPKHFMDILLAKRYDAEDMIILREKDFMHY